MVDILTELDQERAPERQPGDPLTALEAGTAALKRALDPLFDSDLEEFGPAELRIVVAKVGPLVDALEARTTQLHAATIHDPIVRRSLAAVLSASADIRRQFGEFVVLHPELA